MTLPLKKFRELVFQLMYPNDLEQLEDNEFVALMMVELSVTRRIVQQAMARVRMIQGYSAEIDKMVAEISHSYEFNRIQRVERTILRLSIFEMLFDDEIPEKVAISEALRLARKFSTPEAAKFLNAIMDTLYKKSLGEMPNQAILTDSINELMMSEKMLKEALEKEVEDDPKL